MIADDQVVAVTVPVPHAGTRPGTAVAIAHWIRDDARPGRVRPTAPTVPDQFALETHEQVPVCVVIKVHESRLPRLPRRCRRSCWSAPSR